MSNRSKNILENSARHLVAHFISRLEWQTSLLLDLFPSTPRDFAWKVRRRMKQDRNPLFVEVQDKYGVRHFAETRGVRTAELFYVTEDPDTIPFDALPKDYFLKANHGCKWNILCRNGELFYYSDGEDLIGRKNFSMRKITREECIRYCRQWLKTTYSRSQWAYQHIPPKIVIEEVLEQKGGGALVDYRCFTFNGSVKAVQVSSPELKSRNSNMFVDENWKELKLTVYRESAPNPPLERPDNFDEVIRAAERLGAGLDFVRVDLYNTTRGVTLAEMSIYPEAGEAESPTACPVFNQWLGDHWR
ncbi:MAG: hypothetical protein HY864_09255 [Chloroflexi bacterium]|nr:hypothetical protein [Chloroflexota bacterium]